MLLQKLWHDKGSLEPRKEWITPEIVYLIGERIKFKHLTSEENQKRYRELRNIIVKKCKDVKEKYLEEKCSEIDAQIKIGS